MLFTVSARGKPPQLGIIEFLRGEFPDLPLDHIESVFGFVEPCTLYGGRPFVQPELTQEDVRALEANRIGLRLPLSNHWATQAEYEDYRWFLEKYHRPGNSIIVTTDKLARWLRRDYPGYELEASVIKEIDKHAAIDQALKLYNTVVIPMRLNQDLDFLRGIEQKDRITLFANAGCALNCPAKICYPSFSRANKFTGHPIRCSLGEKPRELFGMLDFDLEVLQAMGFRRFKLLRTRSHGLTGF